MNANLILAQTAKMSAERPFMTFSALSIVLLLTLYLQVVRAEEVTGNMVLIPGGEYTPFLTNESGADSDSDGSKKQVKVVSFYIDKYPVTNSEYLQFVVNYPEWSKSTIKPIFADDGYLFQWESKEFAEKNQQPVTSVSWFAALAYCEAHGKTLPTTHQWEYTLYDRGRNHDSIRDKAIAWYGKPTKGAMKEVGSAGVNEYGAYDLVGLIWEWTLDFNSIMASTEARNDNSGETEKGFMCGGASLSVNDSSNYVSFMRYSFRLSVLANYTVRNLGFRCALATVND